jgi:hypothetical protein
MVVDSAGGDCKRDDQFQASKAWHRNEHAYEGANDGLCGQIYGITLEGMGGWTRGLNSHAITVDFVASNMRSELRLGDRQTRS